MGVWRERGGFEGGEEVIPDEVEDGLHIGESGGDGDDGVVLREDDAVLAEGAVGAVGVVAALPELVAIALVPVAIGVAAVGGLEGGGGVDVGFWEELFAVPGSVLEIELTEGGDVFGADAEAVAADGDSLGVGFPGGVLDAEGLEESWLEVFEEGHAGGFLDDGGEHEGCGGVVEEMGAGFEGDGVFEEGFCPGLIGCTGGFGLVTCGHTEEVADAHGFEVVVW